MPSGARYARRAILAAMALAAGSLARHRAPAATDETTHQAVARYLSRLAAYPSVAALTAAETTLPAPVRAAIRSGSQSAAVSYRDYLAFCVMEALPLPADVLASYTPRLVAFVVPERGQQGGLVGAAWLPLPDGATWQRHGSAAGLSFSGRPGWATASGNGLAALVVSGPDAEYLGPGVPPLLANQHCLEQGRSGNSALACLTSLTPCRGVTHLVYDVVEARLSVASSGRSWQVEEPTSLATVVAPPPDAAARASAQSLQRRLEANHGWLDAEKALRLLRDTAPTADCLVLDFAAATGMLLLGASRQELAL